MWWIHELELVDGGKAGVRSKQSAGASSWRKQLQKELDLGAGIRSWS